jgi:hypothetical protein
VNVGKVIVAIGIALLVVGLVLWRWPSALGWVGRLPGDIRTEHVFFPVVSCLVISVVVTMVVNVAARLFR